MKLLSLKQQAGGTLGGFIAGVVVGLGGALVVAVYITKAPVPFLNRGQSRTVEQDAAEAKKNKDWNPNAALSGAPAAKVAAPESPASTDGKPQASQGKPENKATSKAPAASADPLGDLVKSKTGVTRAEQFLYYVQVGAFRTMEDAESHRASLSLNGIESKVFEREQSGRVMYRVRVGPFETKEEGEQAKERLEQAGLQTALVRVQYTAP